MKNPSGKVGTAFGHMDFSFVSINTEDDDETEELVDFSDVDYEDDCLGKTNLIMLYYKKVVLGMVGGSMEIELKRDIYEELLKWKKTKFRTCFGAGRSQTGWQDLYFG